MASAPISIPTASPAGKLAVEFSYTGSHSRGVSLQHLAGRQQSIRIEDMKDGARTIPVKAGSALLVRISWDGYPPQDCALSTDGYTGKLTYYELARAVGSLVYDYMDLHANTAPTGTGNWRIGCAGIAPSEVLLAGMRAKGSEPILTADLYLATK